MSTSFDQKLHWDPTSPTYHLDLAFAACEWGVGLCFVGYFATLITDFQVSSNTIFLGTSKTTIFRD